MTSAYAFTRHCRILLPLLLLAGCAPLEWQKAGAPDEEIERDQARCTAEARSEARLRTPPRPSQQAVTDRLGRVVAVQPASPEMERFAIEQDLIRECMRSLGYTLQREPEPTKP
jgi:hypothetical protein